MVTNVDDFVRYESGEMTEEEVIVFMQSLIDSGLAWKLQGHYGRMANFLLEQGFCVR